MNDLDLLFLADYEEISLHECGKEICKSDKFVNFDYKNYHLFHFVLHGNGTFIANKKKYQLKKGDIFFIEAFDTAKYYPNPNDPWHYIWIGFKGSRVNKYLHRLGISKENPVYYNQNDYELYRLFNQLYESYQQSKILGIEMLAIFLKIIHIMASYKNKTSDKLTAKQNHIRNAKQYIENNYKFHIKVSDIAKSVGLSSNYLANIFKEELNTSTKHYLTNYRINIAINLLVETDYSIAKIANSVGYIDPLHFSAEFKRSKSVSPTLYRKQNRRQT